MENRIDRRADEFLYQPKIHSKRIRILYGLKLETGKPMTVLLDQAIHEFAIRYQANTHLREDLDLGNVNPETWEEICEYRRLLDELDYQGCLDELEKMKNGL